MRRLISSIIASLQQGMQTALDKLLGIGVSLLALPFQIFGIGTTASPLPSQPPVFRAPVEAEDLFSDLVAGPAPTEKVRDLDREGVNTVFKMTRMTKAERAEANWEAIERDDVRALLIGMTQAELKALTAAGPGAVRKLLIGGDSRVWGVPSVLPEDVMPPSETELAIRLRAVKAAMAKPKGSAPFVMPKMPTP